MTTATVGTVGRNWPPGRRRLKRVPRYTDPENPIAWWWYGEFCGSANEKPPGLGYFPFDCLDACCLIHDRCLEGHWAWGYSEPCGHRCCDCDFLDCVSRIIGTACCPRYSRCWAAAWEARKAFDTLCTFYAVFFPNCPDCLENPYRYAKWYWYDPPSDSPRPVPCPLEAATVE
jgi:hypothetical protein